jgi:hypothetical protein
MGEPVGTGKPLHYTGGNPCFGAVFCARASMILSHGVMVLTVANAGRLVR